MPQFQVNRTFYVERGGLFFLSGQIKEGHIKRGKFVQLRPDSEAYWVRPIVNVACIEFSQGNPEVGLGLQYKDSEELEWLKGLCKAGDVVQVLAQGSCPGGISSHNPALKPRSNRKGD
jgi:hypothetical protein